MKLNDTYRIDWLESHVGYVCCETEDDASPPQWVCYLPVLEEEGAPAEYKAFGAGDSWREAVDQAKRAFPHKNL